MSDLPIWQDDPDILDLLLERRASCSAWAVMLHALIYIEDSEEVSGSDAERIFDEHVTPRKAMHGDPPERFVRAFLRDKYRLWLFHSKDRNVGPEPRARAERRLRAILEVNRRLTGSLGVPRRVTDASQ